MSTAAHTPPNREHAEVKHLRELVAELVADGRSDEAFEKMLAAVTMLADERYFLRMKLAYIERGLVGKKGEGLDAAQLRLMLDQLATQDDAPPDLEAEARADAQLDEEIDDAQSSRRRKGGKKRRRRSSVRCDDSVPRVPELIELPVGERICPSCDGPMSEMKYDVTELLRYIPGRFELREVRSAKYACGRCKNSVVTAPAPAKLIERGLPDVSLLSHLVVRKYADHTPLNRLREQFARYGVTIPASTLSDWVARTATALQPIVRALTKRLLGSYVIRTDASGLKVLDPSAAENVVRGTMWCYVGDDKDVVFDYAPTGAGASGPWAFLAGREGYIQADAASVFDRLFNGQVANATEVGCLAHARRRFFELKDMDTRVAFPLQMFRRLYRIETLAQAQELDADGVLALRQERSKPVVDKLMKWMAKNSDADPPGSMFSKAIAYFVNHHEALTRFLDDGRLDLDNNLCERQIRGLAMGRRNYLFAGSHAAAHRTAVLYSIMRTCKLHGIAPHAYVSDVLQKIAEGWPQSRIEELLPGNWTPSQG